ncbi:hypothetical protein [Actinomadura roseirufa]|uniref:hypothetical protein n=1 Tax=Actinomadura roseirufa TaxID=2094049 RepID=UPI0010416535|nr:hypothetical protein [Actinomadura roseirufa]
MSMPAMPGPSGRIGMWGAPGSGKTTFLAALGIAVNRARSDWILYGDNDESNDFLTRSTHKLMYERRFPEATLHLSPNLRWVLRGQREVSEPRRMRSARTREVVASVGLDLLDAPGGAFAGDRRAYVPLNVHYGGDDPKTPHEGGPAGGAQPEMSDEERLFAHLGACRGLILLFDPTRERTRRNTYDYFHRTVLQVARRSAEHSPDRYLPQHLAVCITKFDHPQVYHPARRLGYIDQTLTPEQFPTVPDDLAKDLFSELCESSREGGAKLFRDGIETYFNPERTRYFMTSAVGFYLDPDVGRFQPAQPWNAVEETDEQGRTTQHIYGDVRPINVLEPVIWLARTLLPGR